MGFWIAAMELLAEQIICKYPGLDNSDKVNGILCDNSWFSQGWGSSNLVIYLVICINSERLNIFQVIK